MRVGGQGWVLPVVVEPVRDALHLQAQLGGEVLHGGGAGVGVQEEGDVERLPLLLGDVGPGLLGGHAGGVRGRVTEVVQRVERRAPVRTAVQPVPSLAGLSVLALGIEQLLYVGRVVQPELHPDEGLPPLDAEHVPRLWLRQKLGDGALRQTQDELPEKLQICQI